MKQRAPVSRRARPLLFVTALLASGTVFAEPCLTRTINPTRATEPNPIQTDGDVVGPAIAGGNTAFAIANAPPSPVRLAPGDSVLLFSDGADPSEEGEPTLAQGSHASVRIPEHWPVDQALWFLQARRTAVGVVVDQSDEVAGLVTLPGLVERFAEDLAARGEESRSLSPGSV